MKKILLIVITLSLVQNIYSQGKHGFQVLVSHENDYLMIPKSINKDEQYTGGFRLEVLFPQFGEFWQPFYRFKQDSSLNIQRIAFGGTGYTPQDLAASEVLYNDRPYASLVYGSLGNISFSQDRKWSVHSEFIFGLMGNKGPGNLQSFIHRNMDTSIRPIPMGWHNQIGFENSFVVNYNTRVEYKLSKTKDNKIFIPFSSSLTGRFDIGSYMINVQSGLKMNFLNWNSSFLEDYNPSYPTKNYKTLKEGKTHNWRFNLFLEPQIRFAGYNSTLEGLMFKDDKSVRKILPPDVKRILFEMNGGFNLQICDVLYIKYMVFARSREYEGGKPIHLWGGITVGLSCAKWFRE